MPQQTQRHSLSVTSSDFFFRAGTQNKGKDKDVARAWLLTLKKATASRFLFLYKWTQNRRPKVRVWISSPGFCSLPWVAAVLKFSLMFDCVGGLMLPHPSKVSGVMLPHCLQTHADNYTKEHFWQELKSHKEAYCRGKGKGLLLRKKRSRASQRACLGVVSEYSHHAFILSSRTRSENTSQQLSPSLPSSCSNTSKKSSVGPSTCGRHRSMSRNEKEQTARSSLVMFSPWVFWYLCDFWWV